MKKAVELSNLFRQHPEVMLKDLDEEDNFYLVYLIDSYIRDHIIGFNNMAGFVFMKENSKYKVYWVFQTNPGGSLFDFDGLKIYLNEQEDLRSALKIIKEENKYGWILGSKNINNRVQVSKLIKDIEKSEGLI